nr:hypothetical protein Iba_chr15aCG7370 [Ipomoea batatas]
MGSERNPRDQRRHSSSPSSASAQSNSPPPGAEEIISTMDYSTTNPALNDKTGFVYRLRSLFDSLVALREIYLDFRVRSKDVFLIKSEKLIIFKLDAIEPKNMDQLIMLRRHPMFDVDESRELLLDFVVKFHRIMSIIDNEK